MCDNSIFLESVLKAVPIRCNVTGEEIECSIRQEYVNTFSCPLEVVYVFPTPDRAAVTGLTITVGERCIATEIVEKEQARKDYAKQIVDGNSAFLLESERPNVNRLTLGRVEPGERIVAETRFSMTATVADNVVRINIPTAVAPRYLPCRPVGSPVPSDGSWDVNPVFGETGYMVEFEMTLDPLKEIALDPSPSHPIVGRKDERNVWHIGLASGCCEATRDIVVTYRYTEREPRNSGVLSADGRFLLAQLFPEFGAYKPERTAYSIVLDCSGSMSDKIEDAKTAIRETINHFNNGDSFQIIFFSNRVLDLPCRTMRPVNARSVGQALSALEQVQASGGTEMMEPLREALGKTKWKQRHCILLITDGQVGNDREIIAMAQKSLGQNTRLFTVGIGYAANSFLVNELAEVGCGVSEHVCPGEAVGDKIERQMVRCASAHADDIRLAWANGERCEQQEPPAFPELFDGDALRVLLQVDKSAAWPLVLTGSVDGRPWSCMLQRDDVHTESGDLLGRIWARARLRRLERDYDVCGNDCVRDELKQRAISLSVEYGVLSRWTTYYSAMLRKNSDRRMPVTHNIPVRACMAMPDSTESSRENEELITSLFASPICYAKDIRQSSSWEREKKKQNDAQWASIIAAGGFSIGAPSADDFCNMLHRFWLQSVNYGGSCVLACFDIADVLQTLIGDIPQELNCEPAYFDILLLMIDHCLEAGAFRGADTDEYVLAFFRSICQHPGRHAKAGTERIMMEFCLAISHSSTRLQTFQNLANSVAAHCNYELEALTRENIVKAARLYGQSCL